MDEKFWEVDCINCGATLQIPYEDEDLGHTVAAVCPNCRTQIETTIGVPVTGGSVISPELEHKLTQLTTKLKTDPEIDLIMRSIRDEGFGVFVGLGLYSLKSTGQVEPTPKVDQDGKIKVGTFTEEDAKQFRQLKIKL